MSDWKRLYDVTPDFLNNGIFTYLQSYNFPWLTTDKVFACNHDYYGNYSGAKIISPLVERMITDDTLTTETMEQLALTIYHLNQLTWSKQYETLLFEYNPIDNYDLTENRQYDTETQYGKITDIVSDGKRTPDLTVTSTPNITTTAADKIAGFNSTGYTDYTQNTTGQTGTTTSEESGTENTHATNKSTDSGADKNSYTETLKRHGNIGVTTSQQMIQAERALWVWDFIRNVVYPDIDQILTCPIY